MSIYVQTIRQFIAQKPSLTLEQAQDLLDKIKPLATEETLGNAVAEWCSNNGIELLIESDNSGIMGAGGTQPVRGAGGTQATEVQQLKEDLINTLNTFVAQPPKETDKTNDKTR